MMRAIKPRSTPHGLLNPGRVLAAVAGAFATGQSVNARTLGLAAAAGGATSM